MGQEKVLVQKLDKVCLVTINRASLKNAVDHETASLLYAAFDAFDNDDDLAVAILTGAGDTFCSGADLKSIASKSDLAPSISLSGQAPLGVSRMRLTKPVIAAVEGYAVAGGLELALWCDLRVAAEDAVFGVYCRRFGVPLVDGGTIRLPRLIGQSHALDMILTGRDVSGEEALSMGLANRIVQRGEALTQALELANRIAGFPQVCLRSDRLSVYEQWELSDEEALVNESRRGLEVVASGETVAGASRFANRKMV